MMEMMIAVRELRKPYAPQGKRSPAAGAAVDGISFTVSRARLMQTVPQALTPQR